MISATVQYLRALFTTADLRKIAEQITTEPRVLPSPLIWDRHSILRPGIVYALGSYAGGVCRVCGAVIPTSEAGTHAGWHNDQTKQPS